MVEQHQAGEQGLLPVRGVRTPSAAEEAILASQVKEYKTRGFTVLRNVLSADEVEILRVRLDKRMETKMASQLNKLDGKPATGADWARAGHTVSIGGAEDSALIGYPGLLAAAPEVAEPLFAADTDECGPLGREEMQWAAAVEAERKLLRYGF